MDVLRDKKLQNLKFEKDEMNNWHRINPDGTVDEINTFWLPHKLYNNDSDTILAIKDTMSNQDYLNHSHSVIDTRPGWI